MNKYLRNIFALASGTIVAQLITILMSPVVSRLYSPEDFGSFVFYASIVSALGLVTTLRYEMAINLPREKKEKVAAMMLSLMVAALFCLLLYLSVTVFHLMTRQNHPIDTKNLIWWYSLPALVFLIGSSNIFQHWFIAAREYKTIAVGKVLYSANSNIILLGLGFCGAGVWGLFGGYAAGLVAYVAYFLYQGAKKHQNSYLLFDRRDLLPMASRYRVLPQANMPQAVTEIFQFNGLIYLLKIFFDSTVIGWYSYAMRVLQAPLWLIGGAISQVLYKDASEKHNVDGDISQLVTRTIKIAVIIASPVALVLIATAPTAFAIIFGEAWRETGVYARILAPWLCTDFIRYTIAQVPLIANQARRMLGLTLAGSLLTIASIATSGALGYSPRTMFLLQSGIMSLYNLAVIFWIRKISRKI